MTATVVSAKEARALILSGRAPADLQVEGHLDLAGSTELATLPAGLMVDTLRLAGCTALREIPGDLRVRRLDVTGCSRLEYWPEGLTCMELTARGSGIRALPARIEVAFRLDLRDCHQLEWLPPDLKTGSLVLRNCSALRRLPEGLDVQFLDISDCRLLEGWPQTGSVRYGRLTMRNCVQFTRLPEWLGAIAHLDLAGCAGITGLPADLQLSGWLDLADTGITALPPHLEHLPLRWRGVQIDARIAFQPETITGEEVLGQRNIELRRVLMERMGYDAFLAGVDAEVVHEDRDPGGVRRLLRVPLPDDEPLLALAVQDPSTARRYIIRVPPSMRTCHQAAAWIAGFDNPEDYRPLVET